jgi:hypothetical protein
MQHRGNQQVWNTSRYSLIHQIGKILVEYFAAKLGKYMLRNQQ